MDPKTLLYRIHEKIFKKPNPRNQYLKNANPLKMSQSPCEIQLNTNQQSQNSIAYPLNLKLLTFNQNQNLLNKKLTLVKNTLEYKIHSTQILIHSIDTTNIRC